MPNLKLKHLFVWGVSLLAATPAFGQLDDTTKIHSIKELVVKARPRGSYVSTGQMIKTEVTTKAGLAKMACCSLAESFENSAAVTIGYSDAITGARQIRMLGLSGIYTQMLDESRPIMRGISAPYGLEYTPGAWLNSIQTSKGVASVTAGHEAIAGQINIEPRKPTDPERLFVNAYFDQDMRAELNITSALPVIKDRLSTVILAHGSMNDKRIDHNKDGFMDSPLKQQYNFANRWLYTAANGVQVRAGIKYLKDFRRGGQMDFDFAKDYPQNSISTIRHWGNKVNNELLNTYLKVAIPTDEKGSNLAFVADYSQCHSDLFYGYRYNGKLYNFAQKSLMGNLFYSCKIKANQTLVLGASATIDRNVTESTRYHIINENNWSSEWWEYNSKDVITGGFAEYTVNFGEKVTLIGGIRADRAYDQIDFRWFYTPRAHLKWNVTDRTILRGSGGMGYRIANELGDNMWVLPTNYNIRNLFVDPDKRMEKALTFGGSLTQSFILGWDREASISFDVFHSKLYNQVYADQEISNALPSFIQNYIWIYNTSGSSTTYQIDFMWSPLERLDVMATFRYNDSYVDKKKFDYWNSIIYDKGDDERVEKPLVDRFKGLLNVQYATKFRRWVFDATAQINGQSRLPQVRGVTEKYSPTYPIFFAQVTRKFKNIELYLGCENIGNYTQKNPIISADEPFSQNFNPSVVWGPLMGRKFYAGARFTLRSY